jgi:hypothetical protein
MKLKALAFIVFCPLLLTILTPPIFAGSLDTGTIALFPKSTSEFAFADLAKARQFSWFVPFETQALPLRFYNFEKFITASQLGLGSQINSVAFALTSSMESGAGASSPSVSDTLCVAVGQFDPQTAEAYLQSLKTPSVGFEGATLYASANDYGNADIFVVFLDSSTIAFGSRRAVEQLLLVRNAKAPSINENVSMIALINQANGDDIFWGVLNLQGTQQAIRELVPGIGKFPQAQKLVDNMTALVVNLGPSLTDGLDLQFQAVSGSPQNALIFSQLLQAALLVRSYQGSEDNPALSEVLGKTRIAANGTEVGISMTLTDDQLKSLIAHDTFSLKL